MQASPYAAPASGVVDVRPTATEVAVIHLPVGVIARVHHPDGIVREMNPADLYGYADQPLIATVTADVEAIGWGATVCLYGALRRIRNGRHRLDRPTWDAAVKAVRRGGIAYVKYERRDYYGQPRWTAVSFRTESETPASTGEPMNTPSAPKPAALDDAHSDPLPLALRALAEIDPLHRRAAELMAGVAAQEPNPMGDDPLELVLRDIAQVDPRYQRASELVAGVGAQEAKTNDL